MTIGAITRADYAGQKVQSPVFIDRISFAGDTSYPTGGTPDFEDLVQAKVGDSREIIDIIPGNCGQYIPSYDKTNDKLLVLDGGTATWTEVANTTPLNGTTFNVTVISQ